MGILVSIEANCRRISPEGFAELEANPEAALHFFHPFENPDDGPDDVIRRLENEEANLTMFRLGKEWHALHFLLTGESELISPSRALPPFGDVVQGGTPTAFDATYGPVRALSLDRVRAVADALHTISASELERRFDPGQFNALGIYPNPQPGGWQEDGLQDLLELYPRLVEFFTRAAEAGDMVLLSSD
jgi:hypothetical protein